MTIILKRPRQINTVLSTYKKQLHNFLAQDNLLDELLVRSQHSLIHIELRDIGSGLTKKGSTALFHCLQRPLIKSMYLGMNITYEMIRYDPLVWVPTATSAKRRPSVTPMSMTDDGMSTDGGMSIEDDLLLVEEKDVTTRPRKRLRLQ